MSGTNFPFSKTVFIQAIIILLSSFFFITLFTVPGLQVNDEWITANQLHQLVQGHQILFNEGKFGSYYGNMSSYFAYRSNILGYSMALPLLASIPMMLFMLFGEYFRLIVIFAWTIIPLLIALLTHMFFPQHAKVFKIPLLIPAIIISFLLLTVNLALYYPFPASFLQDPLESAALITTSNLLFSLLSTFFFYIGLEIFYDTRKSLFTSLSLIACSSYIFWGTDAKDHILSIAIIAFSLIFFIRYCKSFSRFEAGIGFFLLGLTAWVRPELGFSLFLSLGLLFILYNTFFYPEKRIISQIITQCSSIFWFFGGLIPFFINNYYLTSNPIYPPFLEYESSTMTKVSEDIVNNGVINGNSIYHPIVPSGFSPEHLISTFIHYYSLNSPSIISDLKGILFFPDNGSMPIIALSPFLIIGIVSVIAMLISRNMVYDPDFRIIILCFFTMLGIIFAYLRAFHSLQISEGVAPDIRYLAPIYIPGGIIGLIGMKYWKYSPITPTLWKKSFIVLSFVVPLILLLLLIFQPFGGGFFNFTYSLSLASFSLIVLLLIQYFIMHITGHYNSLILKGNLILLLAIPIAWQMMMVFLFSIAKFDGYSFWLPITEAAFMSFIIPVA